MPNFSIENIKKLKLRITEHELWTADPGDILDIGFYNKLKVVEIGKTKYRLFFRQSANILLTDGTQDYILCVCFNDDIDKIIRASLSIFCKKTLINEIPVEIIRPGLFNNKNSEETVAPKEQP